MADDRYKDFLNFISLWNKPKTTNYKKSLASDVKMPTKSWKDTINYIIPYMEKAIKKAENDPKRFGVLSKKVKNPEEAEKILKESIYNNFFRWLQAGKPKPFAEFMRDRWAPLGAKNDPKNLNYNWLPNVKSFLQEQLGKEKYKEWDKVDLVKNPFNGIFKTLQSGGY